MQRLKFNLISVFALNSPMFLKDFFKGVIFLFLVIMLSFFSYQRAESKVINSQKEAPTKITSDIIDIKRKSQTVDFLGNVVVEKEDSSLLADSMRVVYEDKQKDNKKGQKKKKEKKSKKTNAAQQKSSIKRIDAKKNVKIFSEEFIATGDIGHYDPKKNIFVLENNVIVNNGVSIASGSKFVYDITTKKGDFVGRKNEAVIGQDKRVIVVIGNDLEEQTESKDKNTE